MHGTMQKDYYWPSIASNVYKTVSNSQGWAKNGTKLKQKRYLQILPATGSLHFVAMESLDPIPKTTKDN